jgi:hypothetical protein
VVVRASGGGAVNFGLNFGMDFRSPGPITRYQANEVVAIWPIGTEVLFIKQALDAAAQTNLIGVILETDRPTHLAVPAAAKDHDSGSAQSRGNHTQRPQPTRLLILFAHPPQPVSPTKG